MRILRVFPRKTKATPRDALAIVDRAPGLFDEADEVHISVAFTWDLPRAEKLAKMWSPVAPVKMGGPALGDGGGEFVPGMYLREGYVITSRGCPNSCWFCDVWKRSGETRELTIVPGSNVQDDNLLACSDDHIRKVFAMLSTQSEIQFAGGLEAGRMKLWIAEALRDLRPRQVFFAYDCADDVDALQYASRLMLSAGFTVRSHRLRCYVLIGYPGDTFEAAEKRMNQVVSFGLVPMAMLYRDHKGTRDPEWMKFQKRWARPALICKPGNQFTNLWR